MTVEVKTCTGCRQPKLSTDFGPAAWGTGGLNSRCRPCDAAKRREWRKANPVKVRKYEAEHRKRYPERGRQATARWREANREAYLRGKKHARLQGAYGITLTQYEAMVSMQGGVCAICEQPPRSGSRKDRLHVDHCHRTGRIRGLLCDLCNRGIGMLRDDPAVVEAAAKYLRTACS